MCSFPPPSRDIDGAAELPRALRCTSTRAVTARALYALRTNLLPVFRLRSPRTAVDPKKPSANPRTVIPGNAAHRRTAKARHGGERRWFNSNAGLGDRLDDGMFFVAKIEKRKSRSFFGVYAVQCVVMVIDPCGRLTNGALVSTNRSLDVRSGLAEVTARRCLALTCNVLAVQNS